MTITQTWGDAVLNIAEILFVTFLLWVWAMFGPVVGDYFKSRKVSSGRKRIAALERVLSQYESDFSDVRLFVGRLVYHALGAMFAFGMGLLCLGLASLLSAAMTLQCDFHNDCATKGFLAWNLSQLRDSFTFILVAIICLFLAFSTIYILSLEVAPVKYRAWMNSRINGIRERISQS